MDPVLKYFLAFLLAVFAIMAGSMMYSQHEKYELVRELVKQGKVDAITECNK